MTGTVTIELPVAYLGSSKGGPAGRFGVFALELETASGPEAPVVMVWEDSGEPGSWLREVRFRGEEGRGLSRRYRVFRGGLWEEVPRKGGVEQALLADTVREGGWRTDAAAPDLEGHPLVDGWRVLRGRPWAASGAYRADAAGFKAFTEEAAYMADRIRRFVVIDGGFWRPSLGPVIRLRHLPDGPRLAYAHVAHAYGTPYLPEPENYFDPLDPAAAEEFVARHFGVAKVLGNPPARVGGTALPAFDPRPVIRDKLAAEMADTMGEFTLSVLPPALRDAVVDLRAACARRWPGAEGAFLADDGGATVQHLRAVHADGGVPVPVDVLGRVLAGARDTRLPDRMVRGWAAALDRIADRGADLDALQDVDFG